MADEKEAMGGVQNDDAATAGTSANPEGAGAGDGGNTVMTGAKADKADDAKNDDGAAEGKADEQWNLDRPDDVNDAQWEEMQKGLKAMGLSQEQAVKVLEHRKAEQDAFTLQRAGWQRELVSDPEWGGKNYGETVTMARKALATFDPDGKVAEMLEKTGYGDNPEIIKAFARAGRALGEDRVITTGKGGEGSKRSLADRFYS